MVPGALSRLFAVLLELVVPRAGLRNSGSLLRNVAVARRRFGFALCALHGLVASASPRNIADRRCAWLCAREALRRARVFPADYPPPFGA